MNGEDLYILLNDIPQFGGVLAANQLARATAKKFYILNTKPSTHRGLHWVVWDLTGRTPYFFDSFARPPEFYNFHIKGKFRYNTFPLQHPSSDTCGLWAMYYIVKRSKKNSIKHLLKSFSSQQLKANDAYILKWVTRLHRTFRAG